MINRVDGGCFGQRVALQHRKIDLPCHARPLGSPIQPFPPRFPQLMAVLIQPFCQGGAKAPHPAPADEASPLRQPRYPLEFRDDAPGVLCPRRLSLQRVSVPMPPSLHRVPLDGFPCFNGTTKHSDSLSLVPPRFVAFALWYHVAPEVLGVAMRRRARGDWGWYPVPDPVKIRGNNRASQVPGEPPAHMRCSLTPVGPSCQAVAT